jgi:hypothetical protein
MSLSCSIASESAPTETKFSLEQIVDSLRIINQYAKQIQQKRRSQTTKQSIQQESIYEYKHWILNRIYPRTSSVEIHTIGSSEYYCLYFDTASFHIPKNKFSHSISVTNTRTIAVNSNQTPSKTYTEARNAFQLLSDAFPQSINDFLPVTEAYDPQYNIIAPTTWFLTV